jgi:hypothetical protein
VGLKDVLRGKRKPVVTEPSAEPWRPSRKKSEDTVEIVSVADRSEPGDDDEGEATVSAGRPGGRG